MKINKRAQSAGEILIYILAIVVFSLTLMYGYKAIKSFVNTGTEIEYKQLENDITNEVDKVTSDTFGTIKRYELTIPGNYRQVCFVKSFPDYPLSISTPYGIINNAINKKLTKNNMFLAPDGSVGFNIGDIDVNDPLNFECINLTGVKVTLKLESKGDHVTISRWQ